jgi:two-component system LytT family response regulator
VRRLAVRTAGRVYAVKVEEIDWIEAAGHYLEVHTAAASHLLRESIGGIERRLDTAQFVRIHRSAIVNVDRIRELQPSFHGECVVVLKSGARLRCSRTYAGRLAKALGS